MGFLRVRGPDGIERERELLQRERDRLKAEDLEKKKRLDKRNLSMMRSRSLVDELYSGADRKGKLGY